MFGRSPEVTDPAVLAHQKSNDALSLFEQAKTGLVDAQALHLDVIAAAKSRIENANEDIARSEESRARNARAINALNTILGE